MLYSKDCVVKTHNRRGFVRCATGVLLLPTFFESTAIASSFDETLVEYLASSKRPNSFDHRRKLWFGYRPEIKYTGTAEQNTELLRVLRVYDQAPHLALKMDKVKSGEDVIASVVQGEAIGVESELKQQSFEVTNQDEVNLGPANEGGPYSIRIYGKTNETRAVLHLLPNGDGFTLSIADASTPLTDTKDFLTVPEDLARIMAQLFENLKPGDVSNAFKKAAPDWLGKNVVGIGATGLYCTLIAVPGVRGLATKMCLSSGGLSTASFVLAAFRELAAGSSLPDADKKMLITAIDGANQLNELAQIYNPFSPDSIDGKFCKIAEPTLKTVAGLKAVSGQFENQDVEFMVTIALAYSGKFVTLLCSQGLRK
jgi:hypothetical protein